ncbi:MAG: hypothetical protein XE08_0204 [Parcubacteria bacterium 32_520]|nr:MAG: hypothetical protein XE08_0204 [Parcubacteria bacterium 32_520]
MKEEKEREKKAEVEEFVEKIMSELKANHNLRMKIIGK